MKKKLTIFFLVSVMLTCLLSSISIVSAEEATTRTTTLDLKAISQSNTMGATYANNVYTNEAEKWVYDTSGETPVLKLKGIDFNLETTNASIEAIRLPEDDITIELQKGTINKIKSVGAMTSYGIFAASRFDQEMAITGEGTLDIDAGICIANNNNSLYLSIEKATLNIKAAGGAGFAIYGTTLNFISGKGYFSGGSLLSEDYNAIDFRDGITVAEDVIIKGAFETNASIESLVDGSISEDKRTIKVEVDGEIHSANTVYLSHKTVVVPDPPAPQETTGLQVWQIVLIIVGSVFGLLIVLYIIGAVLYKNNKLNGKFFETIYFFIKADNKQI